MPPPLFCSGKAMKLRRDVGLPDKGVSPHASQQKSLPVVGRGKLAKRCSFSSFPFINSAERLSEFGAASGTVERRLRFSVRHTPGHSGSGAAAQPPPSPPNSRALSQTPAARSAPPCLTTSPAANYPIGRRDERTRTNQGLVNQASLRPLPRPRVKATAPSASPSHPAPLRGGGSPAPSLAGLEGSCSQSEAAFVTLSPSSSPPPIHTPLPFSVVLLVLLRVIFILTAAGDCQLLCLISCHRRPEGKKEEQNLETVESSYLFLLSFYTLPCRLRDIPSPSPPAHHLRSCFFMGDRGAGTKNTPCSWSTCALVFTSSLKWKVPNQIYN